MKNRIIVRKDAKNNICDKTNVSLRAHTLSSKLDFYLVSGGRRYYLFSQNYTKGVYDFFRNGKTEDELRRYNKWNRNPRLDKTIEKIPMYIAYVMKEIA